MEDRLLAVPDVAKRLGISKYTVRSMIRNRKIAHHRIGRRVLVSEEALRRYLAVTAVGAVSA